MLQVETEAVPSFGIFLPVLYTHSNLFTLDLPFQVCFQNQFEWQITGFYLISITFT